MTTKTRLWAVSLAVALAGLSPVVIAAPAEREAAEMSLEESLERGDLIGAHESALAAREADPIPANWIAEAEILEKLGDLEAAARAYRGYLDALPEDAELNDIAVAEERIEELEERARGSVADEPRSTHRIAIDTARAAREGLKEPAAPPAPPAPPAVDDRVVNKWYFWVTLAGIVAAASAVTAISIKAGAQEQKDALDRRPGPTTGPGGGGVLFRF